MTVTVTILWRWNAQVKWLKFRWAMWSAKLKLADTARLWCLVKMVSSALSDDVWWRWFPVTVSKWQLATILFNRAPATRIMSLLAVNIPNVWTTAWENDLGGFRAYGPACRSVVNVVWLWSFTKYNTRNRFWNLCAEELNPGKACQDAELKRQILKRLPNCKMPSHIDHGYGMDCYAVGPTLGAGVAALMAGDTIIYPYCYRTQEILDNGPLRFTVKLEFNPLTVRGDSNVVETRVISLGCRFLPK